MRAFPRYCSRKSRKLALDLKTQYTRRRRAPLKPSSSVRVRPPIRVSATRVESSPTEGGDVASPAEGEGRSRICASVRPLVRRSLSLSVSLCLALKVFPNRVFGVVVHRAALFFSVPVKLVMVYEESLFKSSSMSALAPCVRPSWLRRAAF